MADDRLKVAQIGVANFGGARRERMRETGWFDLVACYDWNEEAMQAALRQDGAEPMPSYEAMLEVPGIEAVIVSTGAKYHAEQVIAAAERGYHVFVEKPLCSTAEEMQALLDVQQRTGVVIGVGHHDHSHDPYSRTIKDLIESGDIGQVATFDATTSHNGGLMIKPGDWRGDPEKNPGGMLFQCGVHKLHELLYYFGPIEAVSCHMRYDVNPNTQTADVALCHLVFESGLIGSLSAYHVSPYYHTVNIFGTKSNLYLDHRFFDEGTQLLKQTSHLDGKKEPKVPVELSGEDDPNGNLRSFYQAVRHGGTPYPSLIDGARAVAVIFAADISAREAGRLVPVGNLT